MTSLDDYLELEDKADNVQVENNTVKTDNKKFVKLVEEFHGGGSLIFFEERMSTLPSVTSDQRSSLLAEALKTPFYATIPTKTNFVFQKSRFVPFVLLGTWLLIFSAFRALTWPTFGISIGLALVFWAVHTWWKNSCLWLEEALSLVAIVAWTVILTNIISSALLFISTVYDWGRPFAYYPITTLLDWNWSCLISAPDRTHPGKRI